ncbi:ABC transporter substrate-binding protein [Chitinimonas taiwanensis]|uniref:Dipeptide transport system substrate-binding protein n=1 Tax=Chitinimonas taiwanensis DSM 18899 TaxID=1121279 RepID=A0A1K2H536_9NEIS|nr:ABC transporter substrate-binding protein [Chitinimonas taiwanensis]SFZ70273.1 dipeptide transport system substrate-binding protein [Chitinimonas taiwanensis DSM 18899]
MLRILLCILLVSSAHAATLRHCAEAGPSSLDPAIGNTLPDHDAVGAPLFNTLIEVDRASGRLQPGLAEAWTISADGRDYRFRLRRGVAFHHRPWFTPSRPLDARDVVQSLQRLLDPQHALRLQSPALIFPYVLSFGLPALVERVSAEGRWGVHIRLREASAPFLRHLAQPFAAIQSAEYLSQLRARGQLAELARAPIGTGPFMFDSQVPGSLLRYVRHPQYWQAGRPKLDKLLIRIEPDAAVRSQKLRTAECDTASMLPMADWDRLAREPDLQLHNLAGSNIGQLVFNTAKPPLNQRAVRAALSLAIDRQALLRAVYHGHAQLARGLLPPSSWAYTSQLPLPAYDPDRARRLLAAAGVGALQIKLWAMPIARVYNPNARLMAEMIQADWARVGVRAEIISFEWGEYRRRLDADEHEAALIGWTLSADPDPIFSSLRCGNQDNRSDWCNPAYDALVERARGLGSEAARSRLYRRAQAIVRDELPLLPLAHGGVAFAMRRNVQGFVPSPLGSFRFDTVNLAP